MVSWQPFFLGWPGAGCPYTSVIHCSAADSRRPRACCWSSLTSLPQTPPESAFSGLSCNLFYALLSKHSAIISFVVFLVRCTCWQLRMLLPCSVSAAIKLQLRYYKNHRCVPKKHQAAQTHAIPELQAIENKGKVVAQVFKDFVSLPQIKKTEADQNGSCFTKWLRNRYCNNFS